MKILERKPDKTNVKGNRTKPTSKEISKKLYGFMISGVGLLKVKLQKMYLIEFKDGKTILEVACGTGVVFEQIVRRNPNGRNLGIDLSPDMLAKANYHRICSPKRRKD